MKIQDKEKRLERILRAVLTDSRFISTVEARVLALEITRLRAEAQTDGPIYNRGRTEGRADIASMLRQVVDPSDSGHLNIEGVLAEVARLKAEVESWQEACHSAEYAVKLPEHRAALEALRERCARALEATPADCHCGGLQQPERIVRNIPIEPDFAAPQVSTTPLVDNLRPTY